VTRDEKRTEEKKKTGKVDSDPVVYLMSKDPEKRSFLVPKRYYEEIKKEEVRKEEIKKEDNILNVIEERVEENE
jgi:hypothetical protein